MKRTKNNILSGMGSILNLMPPTNPADRLSILIKHKKPRLSAREALRSDWAKVGRSLCHAMDLEIKNHVKEK